MAPNSDAPPAEEIVERLQATDNLPDALHGIQHRIEEYGGGRKETRLEIWERLPIHFRSEVLFAETVRESDFEIEVPVAPMGKLDGGDGVAVQNGNGILAYDAESNRYYQHEYEPPEEQVGHTTNPILLGSSPETNFDVTYEGTGTVAGRETHVLTFRPTAEADSFIQRLDYVTMWVDREFWFPLKREAEHRLENEGLLQTDAEGELDDETYVQTEAFEEVEFDTGLDDDLFHFDPPEDAKRVE